ncbi:MAG: MFS transporter, partial [Alphaproteobacteria bacterium]|nr:MFS transporter [Alphaproteobacteria bacterium]
MKLYKLFPFFLILYEFATYLSNDMYLPAFTVLGADFGLSDEGVQLTMTAWLVGNALFQLIIGPMSDRFGRRPLLLWGGVLFVTSSLLCRYTSSFPLFLLLRCIQGIGVSTMMIPGYATIHDLYDDREAIKLIALMGSFAVLAPMIAPLLGSGVLTLSSWRTIFDVVGILAFLALVGLFFNMPESLKERAASLCMKSVFKTYVSIVGERKFLHTTLSLGCLYGAVILWIVEGPFLLMRHFGLSHMEFSLSQIPVFSAYIAGAQCVRYFMDRFDTVIWVRYSMLGGFGALLVLGGVALFSMPSLSVTLGFMSVFTFSFGMVYAPLSRVAMTSSTLQKGAVSSAFYFITTLCGVLGTALLTLIPGTGFLGFSCLM